MATHACIFRTICIAGGRSLVGGSVPTFQFTVLCNPCGLLAIVTSRCVRQVAFLLCWGAVIASPLCAFIIAQSSWFVKNFFEKSQFYFLGFCLHPLLSRSVLLAKSLVEELGNTQWNRTFVEMSFRTPFVPLLYHTLRGLSRGFLNFFVR